MPDLYSPTGSKGQFDLAATTDTDIYTTPSGYTAKVAVIFANRSSSPVDIRLALSRDGDALADSHYLMFDKALPANDMLTIAELSISEADVLRAWASAVDVSVNVLVDEVRKLNL